MTITTWLKNATLQLKESSIDTARLDSEVLLSDVLGKDRSWLIAHDSDEIPPSYIDILNGQLLRRAKNEPLAYIRAHQEFYGLNFAVSPDTLVPRPETEVLVDRCIALVQQLKAIKVTIADIGTGTGCIAISIKKHLLDKIEMYATDISEDALEIAKKNAVYHRTKVNFIKGSLLKPINSKKIDVIVCNLPYVPNSHPLNSSATQEPGLAIFGGDDGLDLYRELFKQNSLRNDKVTHVLTESLEYQHKELEANARSYGYKLIISEGLAQYFRYDS